MSERFERYGIGACWVLGSKVADAAMNIQPSWGLVLYWASAAVLFFALSHGIETRGRGT